ncbi:MAG: hypothetical protein ACERKN_04140 [Velocimicrobium sp.]
MKKDNNILYFGMFFVASVLAEIYCIIEKINIIGVSIVIIIATYLLLDAIQNEKMKNKEELERYFGERMNELEKVQKALYVQNRKSSEYMEQQLDEIKQDRKTIFDSIIDSQTKTAKIIVKYVREDIKKASSINKASCEKITSSVNQGADKVIEDRNRNKFDSSEVIKSMDSNFNNMSLRMENRMRDIEVQCIKLEQIFDSIRIEMKSNTLNSQSVKVPLSYINPVNQTVQNEMSVKTDTIKEPLIADLEEEQIQEEKMVESTEKKKERENLPTPEIQKKTIVEEENDKSNKNEKKDVNKELSADEIAALFAAAEEEAKESEVVEPEEEVVKVEEEVVDNDPNRQLSEDEIAAMFATLGNSSDSSEDTKEAAIEEPIEEPEKLKEPEKPEVPAIDLTDPNKQLSAEEIAALFASMG